MNRLLLHFDQWRENARNDHVFTIKRKTKEDLIKNDECNRKSYEHRRKRYIRRILGMSLNDRLMMMSKRSINTINKIYRRIYLANTTLVFKPSTKNELHVP